MNDGKGSYSCLCPVGYYNDTAADGQSTCSFGKALAQLVVVQPGVSCCLISAAYNLTTEQLKAQNPGLNCSALRPGQVVNTANPSFSCAVAFTVTSEYNTFDDIANIVLKPPTPESGPTPPPPITAAGLQALNPTAICSDGGKLAKGQVICLQAGASAGYPTCNQLYALQAQDTCISVTDRFFRTNAIPFYGMNPGLDCGLISDPGAYVKVGATGVTVCVGTEPVGARKCPQVTTLNNTKVNTVLYVGKKGDSCPKLLNKAKGACKNFTDARIFKKDQFQITNKVPNCFSVKGFQFCCPK